jgi:hypothetical protein
MTKTNKRNQNRKNPTESLIPAFSVHFLWWTFAFFIFLIPLYYSFQTLQIFDGNKFVLLCIFAALSSAASAAVFFTKKHISLPFSLFFWIGSSIFFLLIGLSAFHSLTPIVSFLGGENRHQGVIFLLIVFILFFIATLLFGEKLISAKEGGNQKKLQKKIQKFIFLPLLISACIVSLLAVQQKDPSCSDPENSAFCSSELEVQQKYDSYSGLKFLTSSPPEIKNEAGLFNFETLDAKELSFRPFGTLGQPNFMAQFLIIPFFLALFFLFQSTKKCIALHKKSYADFLPIFGFSFLALLFFWAIFISESKAGLLGIAGGIAILSLLFISKQFQEKKIFWGGIGFFAFFSGIILFQLVANIPALSWINETIETVFAGGMRSFEVRIQNWKESISILENNMYLGVGADMIRYHFNPIASPELWALEGFSYSPDRIHNIWLDTFIHYGVFAGLFFFLFLGKSLVKGVHTFFDSSEKNPLLAFVIAGLGGTFISWNFGFYLVSDATIFTIFLAIIWGMQNDNKPNKFLSPLLQKSIAGFLIIFAFIFLVLGYKTRSANITYFSLISHTQAFTAEEKAQYQDTIDTIFSTPQMQEDIVSLAGKNVFQTHLREKREELVKRILETGNNYSYQSPQFFLLELESAIQKKESATSTKELQAAQKTAYEKFLQSKKSLGNNVQANISLLFFSSYSQVITEEQAVQYGEEIFQILPPSYFKIYPKGKTPVLIKHFWKEDDMREPFLGLIDFLQQHSSAFPYAQYKENIVQQYK